TVKGAYTMITYNFDPLEPQGSLPAQPAGPPQPQLPAPRGFSDTVGTVQFDGAGAFTGTGTADNDGTGMPGTTSGTYSVAADGTLSVTGNDELTGTVAGDGSVLVLARTMGKMGIGVALRR